MPLCPVWVVLHWRGASYFHSPLLVIPDQLFFPAFFTDSSIISDTKPSLPSVRSSFSALIPLFRTDFTTTRLIRDLYLTVRGENWPVGGKQFQVVLYRNLPRVKAVGALKLIYGVFLMVIYGHFLVIRGGMAGKNFPVDIVFKAEQG